jgi:hypothetical protein
MVLPTTLNLATSDRTTGLTVGSLGAAAGTCTGGLLTTGAEGLLEFTGMTVLIFFGASSFSKSSAYSTRPVLTGGLDFIFPGEIQNFGFLTILFQF